MWMDDEIKNPQKGELMDHISHKLSPLCGQTRGYIIVILVVLVVCLIDVSIDGGLCCLFRLWS